MHFSGGKKLYTCQQNTSTSFEVVTETGDSPRRGEALTSLNSGRVEHIFYDCPVL